MASSSSKTPPSPSLYVRNIPSKIKKPELRRQLYCLFGVYGKVIDVVATRRDSMRGQAFVVFRDLASSTSALRALDGFDFYGSALSLDYARSRSKASVIEELGPEALFDPNVLASMKGGDATSSDTTASKAKVTFSSATADLQSREKKRARDEAQRNGDIAAEADVEEEEDEKEEEEEEAQGKARATGGSGSKDEDEEEVRAGKRRKSEAAVAETEEDSEQEMEMGDSDEEEEFGAPLPAPGSVPNNLLFCGDLPSDVSEDQLGVLFHKHDGFKDVQLLPASQDRGAFAFVEFASTSSASSARDALDGFQLGPGKTLAVKWAKRA